MYQKIKLWDNCIFQVVYKRGCVLVNEIKFWGLERQIGCKGYEWWPSCSSRIFEEHLGRVFSISQEWQHPKRLKSEKCRLKVSLLLNCWSSKSRSSCPIFLTHVLSSLLFKGEQLGPGSLNSWINTSFTLQKWQKLFLVSENLGTFWLRSSLPAF